jgi:hypothetical protein
MGLVPIPHPTRRRGSSTYQPVYGLIENDTYFLGQENEVINDAAALVRNELPVVPNVAIEFPYHGQKFETQIRGNENAHQSGQRTSCRPETGARQGAAKSEMESLACGPGL